MATAIGGISATFGIGGGVGLVLAGVIVDALGASWLFWLGLMALPAAAAIWRYVPREEIGRGAQVDWLGAAILPARADRAAVRAEQGERLGLGLAAGARRC